MRQMKFYTRIIHQLVYRLRLENFFLILKSYHPLFLKFLPIASDYSLSENRIVVRNGVSFRLFLSDYMQWHLFADLPDVSWSKAGEYLSNNNYCILDVGANCGAFSLKLAQMISERKWSNCQIHAFEPNPFIYNNLTENLMLNHHLISIVHVNQLGLGNENGDFTMVFSETNTGGGKVLPKRSEPSALKVKIQTLDEYVKSQGLTNIRFIKIDVEGYEPLVLEGARNTIRVYKPVLYIEITDQWFREHGYTKQQIFDYLLSENYELFAEINEKFIPLRQLGNKMNNIRQFNLLAVEKRP